MTAQRVSFSVVGHPEPAGSKRAFPVKRPGGRTGVAVADDNPRTKTWQGMVADAAAAAMADATRVDPTHYRELMAGAVGMAVAFTLKRPKGHFGVHGIRAGAPAWPIVRPDCTKLLRAVEDALSGIVWRDDAQVVEQLVTKRYGEPEGARVEVWTL